MEDIKHSYVQVRGLKLHVAEIGTGNILTNYLVSFLDNFFFFYFVY